MRVPLLLLIAVSGLSAQPNPAPGVQAFIPNVHWLKRVEPIWPSGAQIQGLQGNVELLVTLNAEGFVTATEPLQGRQIFRQAAADAVRQWQFQPVIRNGHAVAAMTTEMVSFLIPGQKLTPESMGFDLAGQKAAIERINELKSRFPRSNEQVLADLEHASVGAVEEGRFSSLEQLAKAAFEAGDLDKAERYASELLTAPEYPKNWMYGNAVFYGNLVLGRVALSRNRNVDLAKSYLKAAGRTPGSPQLNSFGPNMSLARDLLSAGERDAVLEFFTACRSFWKMGPAKLDDWTALVKSGRIPDFGANLQY